MTSRPTNSNACSDADARLDVMHFERVSTDSFDDNDEEFAAGALDPGSLLNVVEALAKLTHGLPIDPASGGNPAVMSREPSAEVRTAGFESSTLSSDSSPLSPHPESCILLPCSPKKSNPARS